MSGGWRSRKGVLWKVSGDLTGVFQIWKTEIDFKLKLENSGIWKPELKSKVQALPTEQVVHQVAQQHRKVSDDWFVEEKKRQFNSNFPRPEHLEKSSRLSRVSPVVSVHFSQQSVPLLNLFHVCTVSFFLFMGATVYKESVFKHVHCTGSSWIIPGRSRGEQWWFSGDSMGMLWLAVRYFAAKPDTQHDLLEKYIQSQIFGHRTYYIVDILVSSSSEFRILPPICSCHSRCGHNWFQGQDSPEFESDEHLIWILNHTNLFQDWIFIWQESVKKIEL